MEIVDINGNKRECESVTTDKNYPGYVKITFKNPQRSYFEWYTVDEFKAKNPNLSSLVSSTVKPISEDLGRVSISTEITLTDKTKSWKENEFEGLPIWISRGKGEGQVRTVISNGKNTIVIDKPWKTLPNKTSQYLVSTNIHKPRAFGNILPEIEKIGSKKSKKNMLLTK